MVDAIVSLLWYAIPGVLFGMGAHSAWRQAMAACEPPADPNRFAAGMSMAAMCAAALLIFWGLALPHVRTLTSLITN